MAATIHAFTMPKWGLTMERGTLTAWHKEVGDRIDPGMEVCDVETEKIANGVESPVGGWLRRRVASVGDVLPVGALLGIIADEGATEAEIDAAVSEFQASRAAVSAAGGEAASAAPELLEVAGRRIRHLVQRGPGDAVVLVHGFGGNLELWLMNQAALAAGGRTVAALDLPGHGESSKELESGTLDELASVLLEYLRVIGIGDAHFIGQSLGGAICLEAARRSPDRVKSLVLLAPAGVGSPANLDFVDGFVKARGRKDFTPILKLVVADKGLVTRQLVEDTLKYKRLEGANEALALIAQGVFRSGAIERDWRGVVSRIPTLVIWGEADAIIPAPDLQVFAGTKVDYHRLPQCGHSPQLESAAKVNLLIDEFIRGGNAAQGSG